MNFAFHPEAEVEVEFLEAIAYYEGVSSVWD
jgi:hypothetical protein